MREKAWNDSPSWAHGLYLTHAVAVLMVMVAMPMDS